MKRNHDQVPGKSNFGQSERLDFQNFLGEHAPDPPSGPKHFFSPFLGNQNFLGTPLKPVKFWAGSAPGIERMLDIPENNFSSLVIYFGVFISLLVHLEDFERQPGIWVSAKT